MVETRAKPGGRIKGEAHEIDDDESYFGFFFRLRQVLRTASLRVTEKSLRGTSKKEHNQRKNQRDEMGIKVLSLLRVVSLGRRRLLLGRVATLRRSVLLGVHLSLRLSLSLSLGLRLSLRLPNRDGLSVVHELRPRLVERLTQEKRVLVDNLWCGIAHEVRLCPDCQQGK